MFLNALKVSSLLLMSVKDVFGRFLLLIDFFYIYIYLQEI